MKNTLTDLNNYLFECIERVNDDSLSDEELEKEIKKSETIQKVAKTIIDNASVALSAQKHFDEYGLERMVEIPLLGITQKDILEENEGLRARVRKLENYS